MSKQQARVSWGIVLGLCVCMVALFSIGQAQETKTPAVETLLPAGSIIYFGCDGNSAHKGAWEQTAAYEALYQTGLIEAIEKTVTRLGAMSGGGSQLKELKQAYRTVSENGLSLAVSLEGGAAGPPSPAVVLVLHKAAHLEPVLAGLLAEAASDIDFATKKIEGRTVHVGQVPGVQGLEFGWWLEGEHLVIAAGMGAIESTIAVATGKSPNITTNPLWKKYKTAPAEFEVTRVGWFDFGTLHKQFGTQVIPTPVPTPVPLTVNSVLKALGLEKVGALAGRSGYKGRALWSETMLEAPGPRKGLLAVFDQKPITMADLPPLPFGNTGFYACSIDFSKLYDDLTGVALEVAALGPPEAAMMVKGSLAQAADMLGFDPKKDLLDPLGNVACFYGDNRQGIFGMGMGLVVKVDDADTLKTTLNGILDRVSRMVPPNTLVVSRANKQGREIVTLEIGGGFINPSFAVDGDWLAIGLLPQSVEAFFLRVDKRLTNWTPSRTYREAFAELPKEFTSISSSDPRKSYRAMVGLAPAIIQMVQAGMNQRRQVFDGVQQGPAFSIPLADFPPAELVGRPLFPNVSVCTVDEAGVHWTSRVSLPGIPLLGGGSGGGTVATVGIAVALLAPAIQAARTAARRTHSRNNLHNIGIATHNYHEQFGHFPRGTHKNEKLKPEKRLSWMASLLPFLDQGPVFNDFDFEKAWDDDDGNKAAAKAMLPVFRNPQIGSKQDSKTNTTHYVGLAGLGKDAPTLDVTHKRAGMFGYNRVTRMRDVLDGLSNTFMVSESGKDFGPWAAGGKPTIRALTKKPYFNGPDGLGGTFPGGSHFLMGDGGTRFVSEDIDPEIMERAVTINGKTRTGDF